MRIILTFVLLASSAFAQKVLTGTANWTVVTSDEEPNPNTCLGVQHVGNIYVRSQNVNNAPVSVSRCTQGPGQTFTWQPIGHMALPSLTATCSVGELMFVTGPVGGNLYGCSTANTWVLQSMPGVASLATGTYCLNVIDGIAIGWTVCSGGPPGSISWATLSASSWTTLTASQWATLTP